MKTAITIATIAASAATFAQPIDSQKVVLTVNGESVTAAEYYRKMEFLPDVGHRQGNQWVERPPAFLTVLEIITQKVVLQMAKSRGVAPTAAEINSELSTRRAADPDRFKKLADLGVTEMELRSQVAVDLAQFNLVTLGVTVTDAQVTEHYNTNKLLYVDPATVKLRVIVVKSEDRTAVDSALRGKEFADVAREMSVDVTKFSGGDLPKVSLANLPQNVLNEVGRTPAGSATSWIESSGYFTKYLVEQKTEAKQLPLDDGLRNSIRKKLMLEIGRQRNDVRKMMADAMAAVKVEISSPGLKNLWDLYLKDYLTQAGRG